MPAKKDATDELKLFQMPFSGRWRPVLEPGQLEEGDFRVLTNMRYTKAPGIKAIKGMSKINATALSV